MKFKALLIFSIALVAVFAASFAAAGEIAEGNMAVSFDDIVLSSCTTVAVTNGDLVPIKVVFKAAENEENVIVKAWIDGYRSDISARSERFDTMEGNIYSQDLTLEMPADIEETAEQYTLHISVVSNDKEDEASYTIQLQRRSYDLSVLSVDYNLQVNAGDIVPFLVVIENSGMKKVRNAYVSVSIPALGISTQGYLGHLVAQDSEDSEAYDAIQKIVYLKIPATAENNIYDIVVQAYNQDTLSTVTKAIKVGKTGSNTAPTTLVIRDAENNSSSTYVIALTVVLAIVFVVLFIVLVVLLTRKATPMEEAETSYY